MIPVAVIPVLNRFDLLEECIRSIDYPIKDLLIIDNSGTYELPHGLYDGKVWVLNMPANLGVAGSWNLGIKCFPHSPYWLFMSIDNHWMAGGLAEMERLSGPANLVMSSVGWNAFSLGKDIVQRVGLFDENYYPAYYEDTDYTERLKLMGMSDHIIQSTAPVRQLESAVTLKSNEQFSQRNILTNESNYQYWVTKMNDRNPHVNCLCFDLQRRVDNDWVFSKPPQDVL